MTGFSSAPETRSIGPDAPLHAVLDHWAAETPHALALRFLEDGEAVERTAGFSELAIRARRSATALTESGLSGQPVLLALPAGIDFITALFACWHAGAIAVPVYPPRGKRHRDRFQAVLKDCGARHVISADPSLDYGGTSLLAFDALPDGPPSDRPAIASDAPCLLQYTSGSTAAPKGVMISHRNLRAHFRSLGCFRHLDVGSVLSWLPPYHDMGLVLNILYAIEAGIPLTFFSPDHFIQRPVRWLRAISRYGAEMSGAPNFAFDACVRTVPDEDLTDLDLSSWKVAPCGAERIRPETLERFAARFAPCGFRADAFHPGYGLAETTLIVTARQSGERPRVTPHPLAGRVVSCGAPLPGSHVRIADPSTGECLAPGAIGEIRVRGEVVSAGYWQRPEETSATYHLDELKTGDLGFMENGELHVTGRIKDLIIIDGVNLAPEDVESIALECSDSVLAAAAFAWEIHSRETVSLALEISGPRDPHPHALEEKVRLMVSERLGIQLSTVHMVRPGLLPRTTSGKIRRHACAGMFHQGSGDHNTGKTPHTAASDALRFLLEHASRITGNEDLTGEDDPVALGMGSLDATRLAARVRNDFGVRIPLVEFFSAGSFRNIARIIEDRGKKETPRQTDRSPAAEQSFSLTHAQERMWFLHEFDPQSAAYHVFGSLELVGPLDVDKLRASFAALVARHDMLRSRHGTGDGAPIVWLESGQEFHIERQDAADPASVDAILQQFARRPFSLSGQSPVRALLIHTGKNRHVLGISAHHIAVDGWSMRILATELAALYQNKRLAGNAPSYMDYSRRHRQWIAGGAVDHQIEYWKRALRGHPGVVSLPTDFPRPHKPSSEGGLVSREFPPSLAGAVAALARRQRTTPFTIHLALLLLLLRHHGGGEDHVIAIPVANRNHPDTDQLVGTLVNTLPFRMTLRPSESILKLIERVGNASFEMQEHQDAPFELIIEAVKPERSSDHSPLAQVMFDHQEIPLQSAWSDTLTCKPHHAHRGAAQFDLSLLLTTYGSRQHVGLEFRKDLFREAGIEAMLDRYLHLAEQACRNPDLPADALCRLVSADQSRLAEWTSGPSRPAFMNRCVVERITAQAARRPDHPAVTCLGEVLTYQQLDFLSDRFAGFLRACGAATGSRVAVLLDRDHHLPAVILGIWKLGAIHVPLDSSNPSERLGLILSDQEPALVVTTESLRRQVPPGHHTVIPDWKNLPPPDKTEHPPPSADAGAYVIHTSGSTGRPKGVLVSHGALANFLLSMAESPGFTEADRILAVTTLSFDISLLELFLPLVCGGSLEIAGADVARDPARLRDLLATCGATVMQATPATWRMLVEDGWAGSPTMKVLCGGEALDLPLARDLLARSGQLWNLYGPTETTVWSTCWNVPPDPRSILIGKPIANTGIHILSEGGHILPPGVVGQLWISGHGLADGYWNQAELTADRFRNITGHDGIAVRAYQTGDLARWTEDGNLECLGRTDGQVKIRGFRIELGEIESALNSHPQVSLAKAALRPNANGEARLVAWIKPSPGSALDPATLRSFLMERLPAYMVPSDLGVVDAFPLNPSGKVDVRNLASPRPQTAAGNEHLTPTERSMIDLWRELLDRTAVSLDDNWFELGGHSLLALRLFARIHQTFNRRLPLSAILEHPSPRQLAEQVDLAARTIDA